MTAQAVQRYNDANKLMDGVAALSADNMPYENEYADGGVVAFQEGGPALPPMEMDYIIRKRQVEAMERANKEAAAQGRIIPYPSAQRYTTPAQLEAQNSGYTTNERGEPVSYVDLVRQMPELTEPPGTPKESVVPAAKRTATPTAATPTAATPARMPAALEEPPTEVRPEIGLAGIALTPQDEEARIRASADLRAKMLEPAREKTRKGIADLLARGEEQRAALLDEGRGLAAIMAAGKLMQSGKNSTAAIGEAFEAAGIQGAKFKSEQRALSKEMDKIKLTQAGMEESRATGDFDAAARYMDANREAHIKAANVAADTTYKLTKANLERLGYPEDKAKKMAETQAALAHAEYYRTLGPAAAAEKFAQADYLHAGGRGAQSGQLTPAVLAKVRNEASDDVDKRIDRDARLAQQIRTNPQLRAQLIDQEVQFRLTNIRPPLPSVQLQSLPGGEVAGAVKLPG
jgi:hypothetical protein